jgi:hypothetical protein
VGHEGGFVAFGESVRAKPGAKITKTESKVYAAVPADGLPIGRVSKALLYAPEIRHLAYTKPDRAALIKLLKRGALRIERDTGTDQEYLVRTAQENPPRGRHTAVSPGTLPVVRRGGRAPYTYPYTYIVYNAGTGAHTVFYARATLLRALAKMADGSTVRLSHYGAPVLLGPKSGTWVKRGGVLAPQYANRVRRPRPRVRASRPKISARGRKRNPIPKGRELRESFTLSTLKALRNGGRVEKILYEDARDRKHYYHDFEGEQGAIMYLCESAAVGKCVLIVSGDLATPLWEDA